MGLSFSLPEGWEERDQDTANQSLTLSVHRTEREKWMAWLYSLLTFWCLSQYSLFFSSQASSLYTPPSPCPWWWQRRRTQGSVIRQLTPGLGCVTLAAVKRRSSLIRWVVLRDQWLKDSRLHASANPVTLASSADMGTVTGVQLPSPNRITNTCLCAAQTYRHMLFNRDRCWCGCTTCHHSW